MAEAKEKCFAEGKAEGKKEAELAAGAKREEIIEEFMSSAELIDIRIKNFQSAGVQIVYLIKQEHPKWDLSFLYVPPPTDDDGSS